MYLTLLLYPVSAILSRPPKYVSYVVALSSVSDILSHPPSMYLTLLLYPVSAILSRPPKYVSYVVALSSVSDT